MAAFTVKYSPDMAAAGFARLREKAPIAIARALNRSIKTGRTFMGRSMATDTGLKVGTVRDAIRVTEATPELLTATLEVTGKPIPLIEFKARGPEPSRGRGRGVTARLPGGKGRYPKAFIATLKSGHRGVFQRVPGGKRHGPKPQRAQLPIYELHGPSLPKVFDKFVPAGLAQAGAALEKNLAHEFQFAMR